MMCFQDYMLIMWNSLRIFDFGGDEILLDLISPGIMIPNHSRWHTNFFFLCPKWFRSTCVIMVVAFTSHWQDVKSFDLRAVTTRSNTWHCWDNIRRTKDSEPHNCFFRRSTKQGHCSARNFQILAERLFKCRSWVCSMVPARFIELPSPS